MRRQRVTSAPPPPQVRAITLTKLCHVRAELARLYSEARAGALPVGDASRLANLLQILSRVISEDVLEQRVAALEEALERTTK